MNRILLTLVVGVPVAFNGCGGGDVAGPERGPAPLGGPPPRVAPPLSVGGSPAAVATGFDAVWVADNLRGQVIRVNPESGRTRRVPVASAPVAIATGEGAVWVASATGVVERIDPSTLAVTATAESITGPAGIDAGEGFVWVTSQVEGTVTRIDPASGLADGEPIKVGSQPTDIAIGGGFAWVANTELSDGTVTRIDAESAETGEPIEVADGQVFALTYGEDGAWVASSNSLRGDKIDVTRIDPESAEVDGEFIRLERPGLPVRLAAGEGTVWVVQGGGDPFDAQGAGAIVRIDPDQRRLVGAPAEVPSGPTGVSVGDGGVWVVSGGEGSLVQVSGPR